MPPAFSDTGNRNVKVSQQLTNWADQDGTGETFDSSTGFVLPNGATRSPDASWIKLERWNALIEQQKASFAPLCPDFVIEFALKSDTLTNGPLESPSDSPSSFRAQKMEAGSYQTAV